MKLFGPPNIQKMKENCDIKGLIGALSNRPTDQIQKEVTNALIEIGTPAVDPLIVILNTKTDLLRDVAVITLGEIGDLKAVEPLISLLMSDAKVPDRCIAARSLGKIGDERSIGALQNALKDKDWPVRQVAAETLKMIKQKRKGVVENKYGKWEIRNLRIEIINYKKQGNVNGLIHFLEDKNIDNEIVELIGNALKSIGLNALMPLLLTLGDSQRIIGINQLQKEGRLDEAIIQLSIDRAVLDYRNKFI
jgi:hypothetical protein